MSLAFGITSLVMVTIIHFIMLNNKYIPTKGIVFFKRQLILFKIYLVMDMICYIYAKFLNNKGVSFNNFDIDVILLKILSLFNFAFLIVLALGTFKYAIIQTGKKPPLYFPILNIFAILTFFFPINMEIVNNGLIFSGVAKIFRDSICGMVLIIICLYLIFIKQKVPRKKIECFLVWMTIWVLFFIINSFFPQYSLVPITCAFGYLINFIFIENPENMQGVRKETILFYYIKDCFEYFKYTNPHINVIGVKLSSDEEIDKFLLKFKTSKKNFFLFEEDGKNFYAVFSNKNFYVPAIESYIRENNLQAIYFNEFYIKDTTRLSTFFQNNINSVEKGIMRYISKEDFLKKDKELIIKKEIEKALNEQKIVTYVQPIFNVKKKKFTCGECLCRIQKDNGEIMMPYSFISIAEKYGLICNIETEMFKNMCKILQKKDEIGLEYLDANLSIRKGESPFLYEEYSSIIEEYNVDGKSINLEITETDVIESKNTLIKNMNNLNGLGIRFSLDDFGTGESNLGYVIDMPVDVIKFDREIFQKTTHNKKARVVVQSIINMAHNLNLQVIAEGVETESDFKLCEEMDVDYIQGYYFSKPIPIDEFETFCKQKNFTK